jgi:hypothetical protein
MAENLQGFPSSVAFRTERPLRTGADPDFHRRDLWEAIESGKFPEWELGLQIFTEEQAEAFSFDVLDSTKIVPEELVPLLPVGRMVLNRNPDNFFAKTEQVAFCTAHIVPGINFSNDPLLAVPHSKRLNRRRTTTFTTRRDSPASCGSAHSGCPQSCLPRKK